MNIIERTLDIIAPHNCLLCGAEGRLICNWCAPEAFEPVPPRCYLCHKITNNYATCQKCRRHSGLKNVWVRTEYNNSAKKLIKAFKFERAQAAATIIAGYMKDCLPFIEDYLIIPVPTATSRYRYRGYEHSKLLAKELSKLTRLAYFPHLARLGQTRQVGAKRAIRLKQLEGSFRVIKPNDLVKRKILLVDDVTTTGATLGIAAKALNQAGAKQVSAIVFAQTK